MDVPVRLYPGHIETENYAPSLAYMDYLTQLEQDAMPEETWEFDGRMIHEK